MRVLSSSIAGKNLYNNEHVAIKLVSPIEGLLRACSGEGNGHYNSEKGEWMVYGGGPSDTL